MPKRIYKDDFSVYEKHTDLVYLDSAASTLRPKLVSDTMNQYGGYEHSNIHRGAYKLSYEATTKYEEVREKVKTFINANKAEEIIFTYGTTDGINLLARTLGEQIELSNDSNIVVSIFEHHSNIVPWQQLCQGNGASLEYLYDFDVANLNKINSQTKIVSLTLMSNATGFVTPVKKVIQKAREVGAIVILDGAQMVGHEQIDVQDLDTDYLVFSGHKMFGPTGIGVLYGKYDRLKDLPSFRYGGDMIEYVNEQSSTFAQLPNRLEAGTPNIDGVIGLGAAIDYINDIGLNTIAAYLDELRTYTISKLKELEFITIIDFINVDMGPVISFNVDDVHPHDVSSILDNYNIAIRAGHHCAQPLMKHLNCLATCRMSLQIYNTKEDIDHFVDKLKEVRRWLGYES